MSANSILFFFFFFLLSSCLNIWRWTSLSQPPCRFWDNEMLEMVHGASFSLSASSSCSPFVVFFIKIPVLRSSVLHRSAYLHGALSNVLSGQCNATRPLFTVISSACFTGLLTSFWAEGITRGLLRSVSIRGLHRRKKKAVSFLPRFRPHLEESRCLILYPQGGNENRWKAFVNSEVPSVELIRPEHLFSKTL